MAVVEDPMHLTPAIPPSGVHMRHPLPLLVAALLLPAATAAQTGDAVIKEAGRGPEVSVITFPAIKDLTYRVAWHATVGPEDAAQVAPSFRAPANFLWMSDREQVPRANIRLALIVHGTATHSLMRNDAYKALRGVDNASIPLLTALHEAGVQIIVCGAALVNRNVPRETLLPFVTIAQTAGMAHATLAAQGYTVITP
jgi:intracellular sulfur oxidation DsrE/DsrF family protein